MYHDRNRLLIVGAGASKEEGIRAFGLEDSTYHPPLLWEWVNKLWKNGGMYYLANPVLVNYVQKELFSSVNIEEINQLNTDKEKLDYIHDFISDNTDKINIEEALMFSWDNLQENKSDYYNFINRGIVISYNNFLLSGMLNNKKNPSELLQLKTEGSFYNLPKMNAACKVVSELNHHDAVLSLNYDTLLEIGARQLDYNLIYAPDLPKNCIPLNEKSLYLIKPHGSFNMHYNESENKLYFDSVGLNINGFPNSAHGSIREAIIPPRKGKEFTQHEFAKIIIDSIAFKSPRIVTFWGTSWPESDADITNIYKKWIKKAECVEVIGGGLKPNGEIVGVDVVDKILKCKKQKKCFVKVFKDIEDWSNAKYI